MEALPYEPSVCPSLPVMAPTMPREKEEGGVPRARSARARRQRPGTRPCAAHAPIPVVRSGADHRMCGKLGVWGSVQKAQWGRLSAWKVCLPST